MTQGKTLTHAEFAMYAGYIAKNAANWSSEVLADSELLTCEMDANSVKRFADDIRSRLEFIESRAMGIE